MSIPIRPFGQEPLPEPRPSGAHLIAQIPQTKGTAQQRSDELLREIHRKLDGQLTIPDTLRKILKADVTYLMTGFKEGVKDTIDFLRKEPEYSLESLRAAREFQARDTEDFTQTHITKLEPNPDNENEFEIIEAFINRSDDQEIKSFRAKIQIDPEQENFGFIKELSFRYFGQEVFVSEEDPKTNRGQVPDISLNLDLSPLNTES